METIALERRSVEEFCRKDTETIRSDLRETDKSKIYDTQAFGSPKSKFKIPKLQPITSNDILKCAEENMLKGTFKIKY